MPAKLSAQDIYDKEFSVDTRGYSANEVDSYLDQIIEDYQEYEEQTQKLSSALLSCDQKIKELTDENAQLRASAQGLESQLSELKAALDQAKGQLEQANAKAAQAHSEIEEARKAAEDEKAQSDANARQVLQDVESAADVQEEAGQKELNLEERIARLEKAVFGSSNL